tara:strand:+ start:1883 stop:2071 length:189 start_codon:yes stop_codon:yes gene_type:complete
MSNLIPTQFLDGSPLLNEEFTIIATGGERGYALMVIKTAEIIVKGTWEDVHEIADELLLILV